MSEKILLERHGAVGVLRLNRPDLGNAIDTEMAMALMRLATACDEDQALRCILLIGTGRLFCAGGDLGGMAQAGDGVGAMLKELAGVLHMAVSRLARMAKPLVTAINGPAAGAGLSFAVLGDIALAADTAHFTLAYTASGLSPDCGSSWFLPRLIGLRRTQELALTNRRVGAEEAARIGLVTRVVPAADLEAEAMALAQALASGPVRALGRTRALLASSFTAGLEEQMEAEARAIAESGKDEGREGVAAFLAKRKPHWTG